MVTLLLFILGACGGTSDPAPQSDGGRDAADDAPSSIDEVGTRCADDEDCESGVCVDLGSERWVCSRACEGDEDCPASWSCGVWGSGEFETMACLCTSGDETCNGHDDDCDGRIDEADPRAFERCEGERDGACIDASLACIEGALACVESGDVLEACQAIACPDPAACAFVVPTFPIDDWDVSDAGDTIVVGRTGNRFEAICVDADGASVRPEFPVWDNGDLWIEEARTARARTGTRSVVVGRLFRNGAAPNGDGKRYYVVQVLDAECMPVGDALFFGGGWQPFDVEMDDEGRSVVAVDGEDGVELRFIEEDGTERSGSPLVPNEEGCEYQNVALDESSGRGVWSCQGRTTDVVLRRFGADVAWDGATVVVPESRTPLHLTHATGMNRRGEMVMVWAGTTHYHAAFFSAAGAEVARVTLGPRSESAVNDFWDFNVKIQLDGDDFLLPVFGETVPRPARGYYNGLATYAAGGAWVETRSEDVVVDGAPINLGAAVFDGHGHHVVELAPVESDRLGEGTRLLRDPSSAL